MPCEMLVAANDHSKQRRGEVIAIRDTPATWGRKEGPPNYVVIEVPDASADRMLRYMDKEFDSEDLDTRNAIGVKNVISLTNIGPRSTLREAQVDSRLTAVVRA